VKKRSEASIGGSSKVFLVIATVRPALDRRIRIPRTGHRRNRKDFRSRRGLKSESQSLLVRHSLRPTLTGGDHLQRSPIGCRPDHRWAAIGKQRDLPGWFFGNRDPPDCWILPGPAVWLIGGRTLPPENRTQPRRAIRGASPLRSGFRLPKDPHTSSSRNVARRCPGWALGSKTSGRINFPNVSYQTTT
jgi:hypothetical protein